MQKKKKNTPPFQIQVSKNENDFWRKEREKSNRRLLGICKKSSSATLILPVQMVANKVKEEQYVPT
jgi:hypothetical protein